MVDPPSSKVECNSHSSFTLLIIFCCRLQGLKLLVNLSCQDGTVPGLLDTECDPGLVSLLTSSSEPDLVLRCTTLLANICLAAARLGLDKGVDTR